MTDSADARHQMARLLQPLFGNLDDATWAARRDEFDWLRFSNGDVVIRQGDAPDGMYVVMNGRLRVVAEQDGAHTTIGEITPGETVGEFALITGAPRSATVYAVRETRVIRIRPATFQRLTRTDPQFMASITRNIVARQQRLLTQGKAVAPASWISPCRLPR